MMIDIVDDIDDDAFRARRRLRRVIIIDATMLIIFAILRYAIILLRRYACLIYAFLRYVSCWRHLLRRRYACFSPCRYDISLMLTLLLLRHAFRRLILAFATMLLIDTLITLDIDAAFFDATPLITIRYYFRRFH